jgi:hypothetical protein
VELQTASRDGDETWPELGFPVENAQRRMRAGRKEKLERFELILGGERFYSLQGRRHAS